MMVSTKKLVEQKRCHYCKKSFTPYLLYIRQDNDVWHRTSTINYFCDNKSCPVAVKLDGHEFIDWNYEHKKWRRVFTS